MMKLSGVISDRLRKMFTTDEILRPTYPDRSKSPKRRPVPRQVEGTQVSKPYRKKK